MGLPAARWDGNVSPYRRQGGMGLLPLPAAEGWECYALPAAGWDGIATLYRRRRNVNVTPYRRQGRMGLLPLSEAEGRA